MKREEPEAQLLDIDKIKIESILKLHNIIERITEEINRFVVRDKSCFELGRLFYAARNLKRGSFNEWVDNNTVVTRQYAYMHILVFETCSKDPYIRLIEKIDKTGLMMIASEYPALSKLRNKQHKNQKNNRSRRLNPNL